MQFSLIRKHPVFAIAVAIVVACSVPILAPRFEWMAKGIFNPDPPSFGTYKGESRDPSERHSYFDDIQFNHVTDNYELAVCDGKNARVIVIMDRELNSIVAIQDKYSDNLGFKSNERPSGIGLGYLGPIVSDGNGYRAKLEQRIRNDAELKKRIERNLKFTRM